MTVRDGRWTRGAGEEAELVAAFGIEDAKGNLLVRSLDTPHDCKALVFRGGELLESLGPGHHLLDSLWQQFKARLSGGYKPPAVTDVRFVFCGDVEVEMSWGGGEASDRQFRAADNWPVRIHARLTIGIDDPQRFALTALPSGGSDCFTLGGLRRRVERELEEVVRDAVGRQPILDETKLDSLRESLRHEFRDLRGRFWTEWGLRPKEITWFNVYSAQAGELLKQKLTDLYDIGMRDLLVKRNAKLLELQKQGILDARQMDLLKRQLGEEDEDYRIAREHFVKRTLLLQDQALDSTRKDYERDQGLRDARHQAEADRIKAESEKAKTEMEMEMAARWQAIQLELLQKMQEMEEKAKQNAAQMAIELSKHGMEALIAGVSDTHRAELLTQLHSEQFGGKMEEMKAKIQLDASQQRLQDRDTVIKDLFSMWREGAAVQRDTAIGVSQGVGAAAASAGGHAGPWSMRPGWSQVECTKCGRLADPSQAQFCGHCGAPLGVRP